MQAKTDPTTFIPLTQRTESHAACLADLAKPEAKSQAPPARFKMGGIYHICYSDDGTFDNGHSDIVPQRIEVWRLGPYHELKLLAGSVAERDKELPVSSGCLYFNERVATARLGNTDFPS